MAASRRAFLQKAAMFAVAASSSSIPALAQSGRELTDSERFGLETLASDPQATFEQWTGGQFRVSWGGKALGTLVLATVESRNLPDSAANQAAAGLLPRPISSAGDVVREVKATQLQFNRHGSYLPQETYTLDHDWLGTFNLLLVPNISLGNPITYVAVFTRFTGRRVPA